MLVAFDAWDLGPRLNPLLASVTLFTVPSVLMGMTSPFAIKLVARDLATVGTSAGVLYAFSTAGSIVGTISTAFFLVPSLGVRAILYLLGALLLGLSGLLVLRYGTAPRPVLRVGVAALLVVAGHRVAAGRPDQTA